MCGEQVLLGATGQQLTTLPRTATWIMGRHMEGGRDGKVGSDKEGEEKTGGKYGRNGR